jgi:AcrR family transcriptional regulator
MLTKEGSLAEKIDPRIKRTRQLLMQAFNELLKEKSFEAITVQDIAHRATVNRATFYAHFGDKNALLEYIIRAGFQERLRSQLPEDSQFSPENLARLILIVCEYVAEMNHCPPPRTQFDSLMEKQIKAELYEVLRAWLAPEGRPSRGSKRSDTSELAAMVTSWAIYGAAVQWSGQERPEPANEFVQQVLPIIMASLNAQLA